MDIIPFSIRKRMSVIIKDSSKKDQIKIFTKGADSCIIEKMFDYDFMEELQINLNNFATKGLRTLVFSSRTLTHK